MAGLSDIKCFLLDLDGTLYLSDTPIEGAAAAVARMQQQTKVMFITNNSSASRAAYYKKLTKMGFSLLEQDIYSSTYATIDYLKEYQKGKKVYLVATEEVTKEFVSCGITLANDNPDIVVLTFDKNLTYQKLQNMCKFLADGAFFVATHPDKVCPTATGSIPDVGSFLKLIYTASGKKPNVICGKPSKMFGSRIKKLTGLKPHQIAMVGDRLSTDYKFAKNCGFVSAIVLTGEATKKDIEKLSSPPDYVLPSISDWDK